MTNTNVTRQLKQAGISFRIAEYEFDEKHLSGEYAAKEVGMPPEQVFKTLVTRGDKTGVLVFVIPVDKELDLKKAAAVSANKKVEMILAKELLALTGYLRGGCSPVGMKKKYETYIDKTAVDFEQISVSAGIRGCQMILNPRELIGYILAKQADLTKNELKGK